MRRKIAISLVVIVAVAVAIAIAWPSLSRCLSFYHLTGSFFPIKKIDTLQNPVAVNGWGQNSLRLADGRTVQLPGFRSLPSESAALAEVTKRGVQIGADGRIFGLVKIHHWCGNDAVREHIVKVDVSDMLAFLHVGELVKPADSEIQISEPGGTFTQWGWRIEEFSCFQSWQESKVHHDEPSVQKLEKH